MQKLAAVLLLTMIHTPANAEPTAESTLQQIAKGNQTAMVVVQTTVSGITWMHAIVARKTGKSFMCPPEKLAVTADQNVEILRSYVKEHPAEGQFPVGMVMVYAYMEMFPCKP